MSNGLIAFLVALGSGGWIYSKLMRSTGSNVKNSLTAAIISGALIFVVVLVLVNMVS